MWDRNLTPQVGVRSYSPYAYIPWASVWIVTTPPATSFVWSPVIVQGDSRPNSTENNTRLSDSQSLMHVTPLTRSTSHVDILFQNLLKPVLIKRLRPLSFYLPRLNRAAEIVTLAISSSFPYVMI